MLPDFPYFLELKSAKPVYEAHRHNYIEITYIIEGTAHEIVNGVTTELRPGVIATVLPHQVHEYKVFGTAPLRMYNLCVGLDLFINDKGAGGLFQSILYDWKNNTFRLQLPESKRPEIEEIFDKLYIEFNQDYDWRSARFYSLLIELLTLYLRERNRIFPTSPKEKNVYKDNHRYWEIVHYVYKNYKSDLNLKDLSERFNINLHYLSGQFKKTTGVNFHDFLHTLRVHNSLSLIGHSDLTLGEIAYECGFNSYSSFSRMFRKYLGVSPGNYSGDKVTGRK